MERIAVIILLCFVVTDADAQWRRPQFWNWRQGYRGRIRPCNPYPECTW